jgi:Na+-driven multidrug efflux pump
VIGVVLCWTFLPACAAVLGLRLGWGAAGAWTAFLAETTIGAFLLWRRLYAGGWRALGAAVAAPPPQGAAALDGSGGDDPAGVAAA